MSDDFDALMRTVMARPDDRLPKLVFADWLEEAGRDAPRPALAYALRWCAAYRRHPAVSPTGRFPGWHRAPKKADWRRLPPSYLPPHVADAIRAVVWSGERKESWKSPRHAFAAVGDAIAELVAAVSLPAE